MNARSPTEVYLCVNKPGSGPPLYNNYQRGLIKFTNLSVDTTIEWFILDSSNGRPQNKITAVTSHHTNSTWVFYGSIWMGPTNPYYVVPEIFAISPSGTSKWRT